MFKWLRDYQQLVQEISYLEFNLEQTEKELKRWMGGDLSGVRLTPESLGANVEEAIEAIKRELGFKEGQLNQLISFVETFEGLDVKILQMKYFHGMTLEQIAYDLKYSPNYIRNKHAEIMRTIKYVDSIGILMQNETL